MERAGLRSCPLFVYASVLFFFQITNTYRNFACMTKVNIQIKGVEALKKRLMEKKQAVDNVLNMMLTELGEKAVTFSKDNKGYKDHTANLEN